MQGSNDYRLGDLIRNSKNGSGSQYLFLLFGDPALPLPFPTVNDNTLNTIPEALLIGEEINLDVNSYNGYLSIFNKEKDVIKS